jgi:hypothetical protein
LERADPLAPVLPINGARAASLLTVTGHRQKLGVVLRSCEIRALVELVKFQQAKLENVLIIGVDCLGTYPVTAWQAAGDKEAVVEGLLAGAVSGEIEPFEGPGLSGSLPDVRAATAGWGACGPDAGAGGRGARQVYVRAREDLAAALGG